MSSDRPSRWSSLAILGALIAAPLVVRTLLLLEADFDVAGADLRGFVADLGVSVAIGSGLIAAARFGTWVRAAGTVFAAGWCAVNFANYEHIRELGSMAGLSQAGYLFDPTFFRGSALSPTHPMLLVLTVLASATLAWFGLGTNREASGRGPFLTGIALIALSTVIPVSDTMASWRQTNFLAAQTAQLFRKSAPPEMAVSVGSPGLAARDLDGPPIIDGLPRARNVLLVILEGVSGAYLPSLREHHGTPPLFDMPELDEIAQRGIAFSTFVATQRQTNRGEYALLCGEYPKLVTAEANMSELVGKGPLDCLPAALRDAGFSTVYLQAAPMAFMMKDQFMPQAGFEKVYGNGWFKRSYNRNHWGIDDRAFFEQSLGMIDELNRENAPWFLTLLTVGTHHRYNVPPSFEGTHESGSAAWAFEYLDHAIGDFILQLEKNGTLDDTLVLITSDESQAMVLGAPDTTNMLSQAWGFLIALLPSRETATVGEAFAQPDVPVSVTDYLHLENVRRPFAGRSVFRRYDRRREVFWGNAHLRMVAGKTLSDDIVICTEDFNSCGARQIDGGTLFAPAQQLRAATPDEVEWLREAAQRSLVRKTPQLETRRITLIGPGPIPVIPSSGEQYIFGGQFVSIPARTSANVEIEVTVTGPSGWVDLVNNFVVNLQPYYTRSARVEAGQTLRLRYSVNTEFDLESTECRLWITGFEGNDLALEFESAELDLAPLTSQQPVPEIDEQAFQISGGKTK